MNWQLVNNVLQSVLVVVLPILAVWGLTWGMSEFKKLKIPPILTEYAAIAVKAAEQAHLAKLITDKKPYALAALQALLDTNHIKLDATALDAAIEAAVKDMKDWSSVVTPVKVPDVVQTTSTPHA
jgi:hypothetical protein